MSACGVRPDAAPGSLRWALGGAGRVSSVARSSAGGTAAHPVLRPRSRAAGDREHREPPPTPPAAARRSPLAPRPPLAPRSDALQVRGDQSARAER
ncbi:unnamed protein product [Arctia plantaginis]|uniref:Uncharacterized protein n=1 Tax=Arctia plantaginis TaxID=874455 RepID=A0A8S1B8A3_ARCPL|nr:unnamed protein product [Arctia plantaginis]CAB3255103.1 unnamed protein product [Arctia plantaginis]